MIILNPIRPYHHLVIHLPKTPFLIEYKAKSLQLPTGPLLFSLPLWVNLLSCPSITHSLCSGLTVHAYAIAFIPTSALDFHCHPIESLYSETLPSWQEQFTTPLKSQIDVLKFKKSGKGLLVSAPTRKELGSLPFCSYSKKKLNKLGNNWDLSQNQGCR